MKYLEEVKNEFANQRGFDKFSQMELGYDLSYHHFDDIAERYAQEKVNNALQESAKDLVKHSKNMPVDSRFDFGFREGLRHSANIVSSLQIKDQ